MIVTKISVYMTRWQQNSTWIQVQSQDHVPLLILNKNVYLKGCKDESTKPEHGKCACPIKGNCEIKV